MARRHLIITNETNKPMVEVLDLILSVLERGRLGSHANKTTTTTRFSRQRLIVIAYQYQDTDKLVVRLDRDKPE